MKMNVKLSDLRKLSSNVSTTSKSTGKVTTEKSSKTKVISPEINVIGQKC